MLDEKLKYNTRYYKHIIRMMVSNLDWLDRIELHLIVYSYQNMVSLDISFKLN